MNLWHDLGLGEKVPQEINVIIEIPRGSKNKYEVDKKTGLIKLERAMKTAQDFPFDYGFAPQTLWEDDDPLDVVVLTTYPLAVGVLVVVRPIGVMKMLDNGKRDDKIIAVPVEDLRWDKVWDIKDINEHTKKEIEHFFATYKQIENKKVEVFGFEGVEAAQVAIKKSVQLYNKQYK